MGTRIKDIIALYRYFDTYQNYSDKMLLDKILPCIKRNTYITHHEDDELIGFTTYTWLNKNTAEKFCHRGWLKEEEHNSGTQLWHLDFIAKKRMYEIFQEVRSFYAKTVLPTESVRWARFKHNRLQGVRQYFWKEHYV